MTIAFALPFFAFLSAQAADACRQSQIDGISSFHTRQAEFHFSSVRLTRDGGGPLRVLEFIARVTKPARRKDDELKPRFTPAKPAIAIVSRPPVKA